MKIFNQDIKKILLFTVGVIFIILGFIGLFLPFLQGILFLVIGLIILSFYFPKLRNWIDKKIERYPRLNKIHHKAEDYVKDIFGEF